MREEHVAADQDIETELEAIEAEMAFIATISPQATRLVSNTVERREGDKAMRPVVAAVRDYMRTQELIRGMGRQLTGFPDLFSPHNRTEAQTSDPERLKRFVSLHREIILAQKTAIISLLQTFYKALPETDPARNEAKDLLDQLDKARELATKSASDARTRGSDELEAAFARGRPVKPDLVTAGAINADWIELQARADALRALFALVKEEYTGRDFMKPIEAAETQFEAVMQQATRVSGGDEPFRDFDENPERPDITEPGIANFIAAMRKTNTLLRGTIVTAAQIAWYHLPPGAALAKASRLLDELGAERPKAPPAFAVHMIVRKPD